MRYTTQKPAPLLTQLEAMSPDSSKTTLRTWLKTGRIEVNGIQAKAPHQVIEKGSSILLTSKKPQPLADGIQVLYIDQEIVVIDKPEGLLSVETPRIPDRCVHAILKRAYYPSRVFPVHRLDRDTSGAMAFALTEKAAHSLKEQFSTHAIVREYLALIPGQIEPESGTIDTLLYEDGNYNVHVHKTQGKRAITHYKTLAKRKKTTLLELALETGKKNQIRVHLAHLGHPVIGDKKYGSDSDPFGRLALHAKTLHFVHPLTLKPMHFTSTPPALFGENL